MAEITDELVIARLRDMLRTADMETTTEKQLRKTLEQQLGTDLTDRKALIRDEVNRHLNPESEIDLENAADNIAGEAAEDDLAELDADESDGSGPKPAKKRKGRGFGSSILSQPLAAFMDAEKAPRNEVVKKIWEYIRANNLQNPKDKRKIIVDDVLGTFLTAPVNMMSMNKQLSKHCFSRDRFEVEESEQDRSDWEPEPKQKKSKLDADVADKEKKPRKPSKPVRTSDEMAEWLGGQQKFSRAQVTGFFWDYIKKNELRDPQDKRMVVSDPVLKSLTGQDRFLAFGVQKHLKHHFLDG